MKTLCDWSSTELEKKAEAFAELVREPAWYCRKCARVAAKKCALCKPKQLPGASA